MCITHVVGTSVRTHNTGPHNVNHHILGLGLWVGYVWVMAGIRHVVVITLCRQGINVSQCNVSLKDGNKLVCVCSAPHVKHILQIYFGG